MRQGTIASICLLNEVFGAGSIDRRDVLDMLAAISLLKELADGDQLFIANSCDE